MGYWDTLQPLSYTSVGRICNLAMTNCVLDVTSVKHGKVANPATNPLPDNRLSSFGGKGGRGEREEREEGGGGKGKGGSVPKDSNTHPAFRDDCLLM